MGNWISCSVTSTLKADSRLAVTATFWAREVSTDVNGNYSRVDWELDVVGSGTAGYSFKGGSRAHSGWADCWIGNSYNVTNPYIGLPNGFTNGTQLVKRTGSINIPHNSDGSLGAMTIWVKIKSSDDDYGGTATYVWNETGWGTSALGFTTIARASQPSVATWPNSSPDIVAGESTYIHMNSKGSFTHSIYYTWWDASVHRTEGLAQTSGITNQVEFIPPLELLNDFPNAATGWGTIWVTTWNGNTNIGTKSCTFTLHVPDDAAPDVTADVSEVGTLPDGTTTLASLGVTPDTGCYNILSKLKTHFAGTPKYGATLTDLYILINGSETDGEIKDGATDITVSPSNNSGGNFKYSICAKDSRGFIQTVEKTIPFNDYRQPVITSFTPIRDDSVGDTGRAPGSGTSYYGKVGSLTNGLTGVINYNNKDHAVTLTQETDGIWSTNLDLTDVPATNSFQIKLSVKDAVGYSTSYTATLAPAVPTLWIGEKTVRVRSHLCINQSDIVDLMYPIGSIYMSTQDIDPSTLMPDTTWTKLESGTFIEAAGDVAGEKKDPGLPDITGSFANAENSFGGHYITSATQNGGGGAFYSDAYNGPKWIQSLQAVNLSASQSIDIHYFSAHHSNAIYGNSTTVQPKSITVFMWQRVS